MSHLHFLRPWWLLGLVGLAVLVCYLWRRTAGASPWDRVCAPHLRAHVLTGGARSRRRDAAALVVAAALALLALAGPSWRHAPGPTYTATSALVLLLDASRSMDATDVPPSRLVRAKHKLLDILDARREGQTALIAYAAQPFTVTPLTPDSDTIAALVPALSTDVMPAQGSRPDLALALAGRLLRQAGVRSGDVIVVTDSDAPDFGGAAARLRAEGRRVSILAVGTESGAPIPLPGGGFVSDAEGAIVIARLDVTALQRVAERGGGRLMRLGVDDRDIRTLLSVRSRMGAFEQAPSDVKAPRWEEDGPWFLLLALPLAALAFRRGLVVVVLLGAGLTHGGSALAADWESWWRNADQRAAAALQREHADTAAALFQDPGWRAAAHYRAGNFERAVEDLAPLKDARSHYNRGNALARLGRYAEALTAYRQALDLQPDHADAQYNADLIRRLMATPPQTGDADQSQHDQPDEDQTQADGAGQTQAARDSADANRQPESGKEGGQGTDSEAGGTGQEAARGGDPPDDRTRPDGSPTSASAANDAAAAESAGEAPRIAPGEDRAPDEPATLADEHWLRRIPDDPGGLLRRKFLYQYGERARRGEEATPW